MTRPLHIELYNVAASVASQASQIVVGSVKNPVHVACFIEPTGVQYRIEGVLSTSTEVNALFRRASQTVRAR